MCLLFKNTLELIIKLFGTCVVRHAVTARVQEQKDHVSFGDPWNFFACLSKCMSSESIYAYMHINGYES